MNLYEKLFKKNKIDIFDIVSNDHRNLLDTLLVYGLSRYFILTA